MMANWPLPTSVGRTLSGWITDALLAVLFAYKALLGQLSLLEGGGAGTLLR